MVNLHSRLKIAMVAGESSGDFLASFLLPHLHKCLPNPYIYGIGGVKMIECGFTSHWPIEKLSVNGLFEVLSCYLELRGIQASLYNRLITEKPAVFVGIDAPDFNLSLEVKLRKFGIPTVHFISPSIWAWRGNRINKIARAVSHILAIFPFEEEIYRKVGIPVTYVGHPLAQIIPIVPDVAAARNILGISAYSRVVALMPGSRMSEIKYNTAVFIQAAKVLTKRDPNMQFIVPMAGDKQSKFFSELASRENLQNLTIQILDNLQSHTAIAASDAVLVASGTASLEVALHKKPMVISYKMMRATWEIMRRMNYKPWIGLPNILANEFLVPEILQNDATPQNLADAIWTQLEDYPRQIVLRQRFTDMHYTLLRDTAEESVQAILHVIKQAKR
jgi:lipid-A-disaccharide synthase